MPLSSKLLDDLSEQISILGGSSCGIESIRSAMISFAEAYVFESAPLDVTSILSRDIELLIVNTLRGSPNTSYENKRKMLERSIKVTSLIVFLIKSLSTVQFEDNRDVLIFNLPRIIDKLPAVFGFIFSELSYDNRYEFTNSL